MLKIEGFIFSSFFFMFYFWYEISSDLKWSSKEAELPTDYLKHYLEEDSKKVNEHLMSIRILNTIKKYSESCGCI